MLGARALGLNLPRVRTPDDLQPNTTAHIGAGVLLKYKNKVPHVAVIIGISEKGMLVGQTNKPEGEYSEEWLPWNHYAIRGFWADDLSGRLLVTKMNPVYGLGGRGLDLF